VGPPALERGEREMMEVRDLTVRFGGRAVLEGLTLQIPLEGLTYLSAPSGAGKTTLLRALAGLLTPDAGQVSAPARCAVLFQEDRLFPGLAVRGQVEAVLPKERRGEAAGLLALVELTDAAEKMPRELSGGMARRCALARCLAVEGEVWLLDEPFAGVDLPCARRILARLRELERPMVITGHAPEISELCDRQIALGG